MSKWSDALDRAVAETGLSPTEPEQVVVWPTARHGGPTAHGDAPFIGFSWRDIAWDKIPWQEHQQAAAVGTGDVLLAAMVPEGIEGDAYAIRHFPSRPAIVGSEAGVFGSEGWQIRRVKPGERVVVHTWSVAKPAAIWLLWNKPGLV